MTDLYSRRRRARKLANGELEKSESEDDGADPWDTDLDGLDYAGVVQKVADDLDDDRAAEVVKSLRGAAGGDDDVAKAIQRHNIFAGEGVETDLDPLDYSDLDKSTAEREREQLARELVDELERRGLTPAGDDEDGETAFRRTPRTTSPRRSRSGRTGFRSSSRTDEARPNRLLSGVSSESSPR